MDTGNGTNIGDRYEYRKQYWYRRSIWIL